MELVLASSWALVLAAQMFDDVRCDACDACVPCCMLGLCPFGQARCACRRVDDACIPATPSSGAFLTLCKTNASVECVGDVWSVVGSSSRDDVHSNRVVHWQAAMEEDFDRELKVLVVGNGGVGKTSMIRRFAKGIYTDEYKKTIGVDFLEKALFVDDLAEEVRFMLWDTGEAKDNCQAIVLACCQSGSTTGSISIETAICGPDWRCMHIQAFYSVLAACVCRLGIEHWRPAMAGCHAHAPLTCFLGGRWASRACI